MKKITTEIVGTQVKFDQRESIFTRAASGEERDPKVRKWADVHTPDPFYGTLMGIPRDENCITFHLVPAVHGPVNPKKTNIDGAEAMTERIKGIGRFFGADAVGVALLNQAYVASHRADEYTAGTGEAGRAITNTHAFAISLIFRRDYHLVKAGHSFIDGAEGCYVYNKAAVTACQLAAYIRELGFDAMAHHEREEQVLQVPIAVEAGTGELGRLGILMTPGYGPRVRIATVTTDLPLVPDDPIDIGVQKMCSVCKKCASNCPSGAIPKGEKEVLRGVKKWVIEPKKCLGFWGTDKERWDDCSTCISVCPYNRPDTWFNRAHHKPWFFRVLKSRLGAAVLLFLDDIIRGKKPRFKVGWLGYKNY